MPYRSANQYFENHIKNASKKLKNGHTDCLVMIIGLLSFPVGNL